MKFQAQIILVDYRAINDYNRDMGSGSYSNRDYLEVQIHNGLFMNEINIAHISQKGTGGHSYGRIIKTNEQHYKGGCLIRKHN